MSKANPEYKVFCLFLYFKTRNKNKTGGWNFWPVSFAKRKFFCPSTCREKNYIIDFNRCCQRLRTWWIDLIANRWQHGRRGEPPLMKSASPPWHFIINTGYPLLLLEWCTRVSMFCCSRKLVKIIVTQVVSTWWFHPWVTSARNFIARYVTFSYKSRSPVRVWFFFFFKLSRLMRDALRGLGFTKGLIIITHRLSFLNNTLFSTTKRLKKVSLGERVVIYNIYYMLPLPIGRYLRVRWLYRYATLLLSFGETKDTLSNCAA